jgi:hypothetical protein
MWVPEGRGRVGMEMEKGKGLGTMEGSVVAVGPVTVKLCGLLVPKTLLSFECHDAEKKIKSIIEKTLRENEIREIMILRSQDN